MGNAEVHNLASAEEDCYRRSLDLSQKLDHQIFGKHVNGEFSESCLRELPWELRDTICLFENVNLAFNCLTSLPASLPFRLPHLSILDVSYNQLSLLPESFGLCIHLRVLILSHNCLERLPDTFTNLHKLEKIDLSNNDLTNLPEDLGKMNSLKKINVGHNKLTSLPKSLGTSRSLKILISCGNQCEVPSQNICDSGSEATILFLRQLTTDIQKMVDIDSPRNVFPRVRGNQVSTSVPNPHSARAQYLQLQTETMNTASRVKTPLLPPSDATSLPPDELRDKVIGLIYGAVIGDALGLCTEFLPQDVCQFQYEEDDLRYEQTLRDSHRLKWQMGDWTANSDEMFLVLDSLLRWGGVIDELDFAQRLLRWKRGGFPELGDTQGHFSSHTTSMVLQDESYPSSPHSTVQKVLRRSLCSNGSSKAQHCNVGFNDNGALSRAAILGIPHFHNLGEVSTNSLRICLATHASPPCKASSLAISLIVALIFQGKLNPTDKKSVEEHLKTVQILAAEHLTDLAEVEEFTQCFAFKDFGKVGLSEPGLINHTYKPLCAALAALHTGNDFRLSLSSLVMCGGHASINGCVVGAVLGCCYGYQRLPETWVQDLLPKQRHWANERINALLDIMGLP